MRTLARVATLASTVLLACGGDKFTAAGTGGQAGGGATGGSSAGSGTGGSAGGAGAGGASGSGVSSGGSDAGSAGASGAGSAGAPPACLCPSGEFCRAGMCRPCSDISSIEFSEPVEILDHPDAGLRFPRPSGRDEALFFTLASSAISELWYTDDPEASASFRLGDAQTPWRSALVPVSGGSPPFEVVFDEQSEQLRIARSATWDGQVLSNEATLASPLSPGGFDTYSLAVAGSTGRYYWMSTRDGPPALRTGVLGMGQEDVVELQVPARGGGNACARTGDDATPWVSENGSLMLFSAPAFDAQCAPLDGGASDLYAVPLVPSTGLPLTTAVALATVNRTADTSSETDPSFSPDLCRIYFASDGGQAGGHDFRLYRAERR